MIQFKKHRTDINHHKSLSGHGAFFQPKLTINEPGDEYEREADAVADKVMRMPANGQPFFAPKPPLFRPPFKGNVQGENIQRQEKTDDNKNDFPKLTLSTSFLPSSQAPDYLAMRQPFLNRNVPHLWDPDAALGVWNYNFNFFHRLGLSPDLSTTFSDITAPKFIDAQLKAGNPSWWEITDQQLKTTTYSGSVPILEFDPNFSPKAPSWYKKIFKKEQSVQRSCSECEKEGKISRKENAMTAVKETRLSNYIDSLSAKGSPLPEASRKFFEPRMGYDFSQVKIHTYSAAGESAKSINALAYTKDNNIVFGNDQYQPGSAAGKKLLAHELTHVVQQAAHSSNLAIQRKDGGPPKKVAGTVFHPGIMHNHQPSGRWSDVQADPNSATGINTICRHSDPAAVVFAAAMYELRDKPIAADHLGWFLKNGNGANYNENNNLELLLKTDSGAQAKVLSIVPKDQTTGVFTGNVAITQDDYDDDEFKDAFGEIDRLDFEIDFDAKTLHAWFQDRYEWHPVYPFYKKFSDDYVRPTNCVHAAAVELKSGAARDYWMKGEVTIPLSAIKSAGYRWHDPKPIY